jgi:hypothetical protein
VREHQLRDPKPWYRRYWRRSPWRGGGLGLPIVQLWGYDSLHSLRLLDGIVDIYMPDMKYGDDRVGEPLSGVSDYVARSRAAVLEMPAGR